jgi:heat shock protein HslJ
MDQFTGVVWSWEKTQYNDGATITAADPDRYLLEFLANGRLAIKADCNQVGGSYQAEGNNLTIQLGPSTLVACLPDSQADAFLKGLANVGSYMFADGKLVLLLKVDSGSMTFAASDPTAIAGTSWNVTGINNGKQAVVSVINGTTVTLNFAADGKVNGSAGCNNYFGPYTTNGDQIKIGPLGSTRKMCGEPEGVMEQETNFRKALEAGTTFKITGNQLVIRNADNAMQVTAAQ